MTTKRDFVLYPVKSSRNKYYEIGAAFSWFCIIVYGFVLRLDHRGRQFEPSKLPSIWPPSLWGSPSIFLSPEMARSGKATRDGSELILPICYGRCRAICVAG